MKALQLIKVLVLLAVASVYPTLAQRVQVNNDLTKFTTDTCDCITPPSGMVGWWTGDGNANDISGNGNHGILMGGAGFGIGKVLQGFSIISANDYVRVPHSPSINIMNDFSIDAWINTNDSIGTLAIVDKRIVSNNPIGFVFFIYQGKLGFQLGDGSPTLNHIAPTPKVADGQWHHVAVTVKRRDPNGGKLYVDGNLVYTFDPTTRPGNITNTSDLLIGDPKIFSFGSYLYIDEVELFNRALDASEVYAIWAAGSCGKCKESSQHEFGQLCIIKFNDLNGDGRYSPANGEELLENWQFMIKDSMGNVVDSIFTSNNPDIPSCVTVPAPGTYTITEVVQPGWTPTTPNPRTVTVQPGQTINLYFGNKQGCSCITPPSGMVGWWTGDGNANDISGNGNHGTLMGGAGFGIGKVLQGFSIISANDYVKVPHSPSINIMNDFSIDAWIITGDSTGTLTIVDKRGGNVSNPIGFVFFISQGKLGFQLGDGSPTLNHIAPTPKVADGQWHHVAVTVKRKDLNGGKLYVDGNLVYTFNPTTRPGNITNTSDLWIGRDMLLGPVGFNGYIDEVELFNRELDASEVYAIWAADSCGKCKEPVSVEESKQIPEKFELMQNYPNPFNPTTVISFGIPSREFVTLKVFDALGREVAVLVSEELPAGMHSRQWNAEGLESGVYFYRLQAGSFAETKKLILLK